MGSGYQTIKPELPDMPQGFEDFRSGFQNILQTGLQQPMQMYPYQRTAQMPPFIGSAGQQLNYLLGAQGPESWSPYPMPRTGISPGQGWDWRPYGAPPPDLGDGDGGGGVGDEESKGGRGRRGGGGGRDRGPRKGTRSQMLDGFQPMSPKGTGEGDQWRPAETRPVDWGHAKKFPGAGENVGQDWQRGNWGGHVIWNEDLGWQDFPTMAKMYSEAGGPVSQEQMMGWGLTPQMGSEWQTHFPERKTLAQQRAGEQDGPSAAAYNRNMLGPGGGVGPYPSGVPPVGAGPPQYPEYGGGEVGQMPMPGIFGPASRAFREGMRGEPVTTEPWQQARKAQAEENIFWGMQEPLAQSHLTGGRYSSGLQNRLAQMGGREMGAYETELAGLDVASREAAKQRALAAAQGGVGLGQAQEGIQMGRIGAALGMGPQLWQTQQQMMQPEYQEWLRTQPAYNPFLQSGQQWGQSYPFGAGGSQVPDPLASIFGGALSMIPWGAM